MKKRGRPRLVNKKILISVRILKTTYDGLTKLSKREGLKIRAKIGNILDQAVKVSVTKND